MPRFQASVESLQNLPAFQEVVLCIYAGLTWTEATRLTRRERVAFLNCYGELKREEARLIQEGQQTHVDDED